MGPIGELLGKPLGWIMYWIYEVVNNYGFSIIIFYASYENNSSSYFLQAAAWNSKNAGFESKAQQAEKTICK